MTALTHEAQSLLGPVLWADIATARACLAGVVGIYLHTEGTGTHRFIVQETAQLRKGPATGVAVGSALLLRGLFAVLPFGALTNARQLFQANKTVGMGVQNVLTDRMVRVQLQPSLSLAQEDASSCRAASAFLLKSFLESGVVVGFGSYCLSRVELGAIVQRGNGGKIALAHIHTNNARMALRHGIRRLDGQAYQQVEAFPGLVIPEFGFPKRCRLPQQGNVLGIALVGQHHAPGAGQETHALLGLEGVVVPIDVDQGGRNVVGGRIQALKPLFGVAQTARFGMLPGLGPQGFVGGSHLPGNTACHLGRQAKPGAHIRIGRFLEALAITRLAMGERVGTDIVQGIAVRQLGLSQGRELIRRRG